MRINRFEMEPIVTIISFLQATTVILLQITSTVSSNSKNQDLVVNSTISPSSPSTPCFAGLQCVFGTCSDNASRCNCYRGWAGLLCDAACPRDCGDRGLCAVGAEGQPYCKCHVGFSGVNCEKTELLMTVTPSSFKDMTSLRPLSDRQCPAGFNCRHGYCRTLFTCACDDGWTGLFCHKPCTLDCGRHGRCSDVYKQQTCVCDAGFHGDRCEHANEDEPLSNKGCHNCTTTATTSLPTGLPSGVLDMEVNTSTGTPTTAETTAETTAPVTSTAAGQTTTHTTNMGLTETIPSSLIEIASTTDTTTQDITMMTSPSLPTGNAGTTSEYGRTEMTSTLSRTLSPATTSLPGSSHQCMPGFLCQHGTCVKGQLKCECNKGWTGAFCSRECSLDCGDHGQCLVRPGHAAYCSCVWPYSGSRCQHKRNVSTSEIGTTEWTYAPLSNTALVSSPTAATSEGITLRPVSVRTCVPGFVCRHGYCRNPRNHSDLTITGIALECVCDRGWKGVFCHVKCPLDCGIHGNCSEFTNKTLYCSCDYKYMGPKCDRLRPPPQPETVESTWQWWVVGSCVVLLLVLLVLLVALPYWLWKRKEIFIMKIVYLFQPFEEEDDKLYDAFVSYKSTEADEHFVVHTLYPRLEQELDFKLCLHFRDFIPGETIANNIIKAMENSRRTILVLTPSYVQSEFCRFEYQRAQHEMLKRKQRIIPIVLQDISSDRMFMDETLRNILDTITYITWPGDEHDKKVERFWKRLELSMPKKRKVTSSLSSKDVSLSDVVTDLKRTSHGKTGYLTSRGEQLETSLNNGFTKCEHLEMMPKDLDISKNDLFGSFNMQLS